MKKIKNFFGSKAETATQPKHQVNNTPERECFIDLVHSGNYAEVYGLLKGGFDPNQRYEFIDSYSYDNGAITGTEVVRGHILDVVRDEAMQKLLRAFGAKTSAELAAEASAAREAEKVAEKEKKMQIVDELLAQ